MYNLFLIILDKILKTVIDVDAKKWIRYGISLLFYFGVTDWLIDHFWSTDLLVVSILAFYATHIIQFTNAIGNVISIEY